MQHQDINEKVRLFLSKLFVYLFILPLLYNAVCYGGAANEFDEQFDEFVTNKMHDDGIPGAVIVVVKDGRLFFSRGYGYANLEENIAVDPSRTLFRVGSISKVINGTAVMQMVEQSRLDLHTDINVYLENFKIPQTFPKPVTTAHLLTHTAGFDDRYIGKSARNPDDRLSLAEYCRLYLPERFIEPGEMFTYSNYGNALAGYLVEIASGVPFAEYVDSAILQPLGMHYSGFELRDELEPYLARGYSDMSGSYRTLPYDYLLDMPAGQFVASGEDMARFMSAHLQGGELNGNRILSDTTISEMHREQFKNHPALNDGTAYTFGIRTVNGRRTLTHGGAYAGFFALLYLFPEEEVGIFIAANILKPNFVHAAMQYMVNGLLNETDTLTIDEPYAIPDQFDTDIQKFAGTYRDTRYPRKTFDKLSILTGIVGGEMKLRTNDEGMLLMPDLFGNERRLVKTGPLLFQSMDDNYKMTFRESGNGRITHVFTSGVTSLERIPWYTTTGLHRMLFVIFPLFFLMTAFLTIGRYILRKLRPASQTATHPHGLILNRLHVLIAVTFIMYLLLTLAVIAALVPVEQIVSGFPYGLPSAMYAVQLIPFVTILLTVGLFIYVVREWFDKNITLLQRIYYSGYLFVSVGAILFLGHWNLIGFHF